MKKSAVFTLIFIVAVSVLPSATHAATKFWIGSAGGSFSTNANWSTSSGGAANTTAPGTSDVATFDSGGPNNATIDSAVSVGGIDIKSTYTGTVSQTSADVIVGTSNFAIAGGGYSAGSSILTVNGTFTLSGGTFTASSATTTFKGNFTRTAGTYAHNGGKTVFELTSTASMIVAASGVTFNDVTFLRGPGWNGFVDAYLDQSFTVAGTMSIDSYYSWNDFEVLSRNSNNPTITVGNLNFPSSATSSNWRNLGSATAANNLNISITGDLIMNESESRLYATTTFSGTGAQAINKTTGNIVSPAVLNSTKSSGTLTITSYGYTDANDRFAWTGGAITLGGNLITLNTFVLSGGTFTASSATTTFKGNFTRTGGTFAHNNGNVVFDVAGIQNIVLAASGVTFNNVLFMKSPAYNGVVQVFIDQSFTVTGTMSIDSYYSWNDFEVGSRNYLSPTVTVGTLILPSTATSSVQRNLGSATAGNNLTLAITGDFIMSESEARLYATTTFVGTGDQTITKNAGFISPLSTWSSSKPSGNLTLAAYSYTLGSSEKITWTGGTISLASNPIDFNQFTLTGGTLIASTATTSFRGNFTRTGGTFNANGGIVVFDPYETGSITVAAGGLTFNNVTFTKSGASFNGTGSIILSQAFAISGTTRVQDDYAGGYSMEVIGSGNPTITMASLEFPDTAPAGSRFLGSATGGNNFTITVSGDFSMTDSAAGIYTPITFNGTGNQNISRANGTINSQSAWTVDKSTGSAILGSSIAHPGSVTVATGTLDLNGLTPFTATGGLTVQSAGTLKLKGTETLTAPTLNSGSTVYYYGTSSPVTMKGYTYHHLTVGGSGNTFTPTTTLAALTVNGNLTILAGTLDLASRNLTLGGSSVFSNDDTLKLQGGETLTNFTNDTNSGTTTYNGTSAYSSLNAGNNYYNLSFGSTIGGAYTLNAALDVNSNLTIGSSTLSTGGNGITLAGTWSNSGTFTHGSGTVTLDGTNQIITGSNNTTFYNLAKTVSAPATLTFNNSRTTTIANNVTLKGASGNRLSLRSLTNGAQSAVNYSNSGTRDIRYVDVKDNNNTNATAVTCSVGCVSSGNNLNWLFIPDAPTSFMGSALSTTSIQWTWTDNASGETGFKLYNSSNNALIATIATPDTTSYNETGLVASTSYGRYITAYGPDGESAHSNSATSTTNPRAFSTVTTQAATSVTLTSATLNGTITDVGATTPFTRGFAYGTTTNYGATTTESGSFGMSPFSVSVSSLTCGVTYHFRAYSVNQAGTSTGGDLTFSTAGQCSPAVTTSAASGIGPTSATLNGNITNAGVVNPTSRGFFYGLTTAYGATTTETGSFSTGTFSAAVSPLSCNSTYHFQAYAVNSYGTSTGSDQTLSTLTQCIPVLTTGAASDVSQTGATLNGSIDDVGEADPTERGFAWGLTTDYGATTTETGSFSTGDFTSALTTLVCNSTYHFRSYAVNTAGVAYGSDGNLTTAACPVVPASGGGNHSSAGGRLSAQLLAPLLAPGPATEAYLNSLAQANGCPKGYICMPIVPFQALSPTSTASTTSPGALSGASFARSLEAGQSGADVKALQIYLNAHGYPVSASGPGSPGHETTLFGAKTKAALIKFQRAHGIPGTGFFGPITRAYVNSH